MSGELPGDEKVICNVCGEQIDEAVGSAYAVKAERCSFADVSKLSA